MATDPPTGRASTVTLATLFTRGVCAVAGALWIATGVAWSLPATSVAGEVAAGEIVEDVANSPIRGTLAIAFGIVLLLPPGIVARRHWRYLAALVIGLFFIISVFNLEGSSDLPLWVATVVVPLGLSLLAIVQARRARHIARGLQGNL